MYGRKARRNCILCNIPKNCRFSTILCRKEYWMSKIVKLSKLAVVLSTLLVFGSMTALPVAYANNVIGQPDPGKYCADHGYQYLPMDRACARHHLAAPQGVPLNTAAPQYESIPSNSVLCSEQYPGSKFQANPFGCVRG